MVKVESAGNLDPALMNRASERLLECGHAKPRREK